MPAHSEATTSWYMHGRQARLPKRLFIYAVVTRSDIPPKNLEDRRFCGALAIEHKPPLVILGVVPLLPSVDPVDIDATHVIFYPRPPPTTFAYWKRSNTDDKNGLGMRLGFSNSVQHCEHHRPAYTNSKSW